MQSLPIILAVQIQAGVISNCGLPWNTIMVNFLVCRCSWTRHLQASLQINAWRRSAKENTWANSADFHLNSFLNWKRCRVNPPLWPRFSGIAISTKWIIRRVINKNHMLFARENVVRSKKMKISVTQTNYQGDQRSVTDLYVLISWRWKHCVFFLISLPKGSVKYVSNDIEFRTTEISWKHIAFMVLQHRRTI